MPEGPEVFILCEAINRYYGTEICKCIGKHLILPNQTIVPNDGEYTDILWSFGLNGTIKFNDCDELYKPIDGNWIYGINQPHIYSTCTLSNINWLTSDEEVLTKFATKISKLKGKLGPILIKQSKIVGIGIAWGSEILHRAKLHPNLACNQQNFEYFVSAIIEIRKEIIETYTNYLNTFDTKPRLKEFIEDWFENLYTIRHMNVYKKGTEFVVSGRSWWI
jgi:formamidopyrimidine-DNA glycosylase